MNSSNKYPIEVEIDVFDILWKLLMQWKAILIACIITALLASGAKYLKDSKAYKSALSEAEQTLLSKNSITTEERIADILDSLSPDQASPLLFILEQQEMIGIQQEYLNNSIWINIDPASQRTVKVRYLLKADSNVDLQVLVDAYTARLRRESFITELREVIDPDAKLEYIYELVSSWGGTIADSDVSSTMFTIQIVLPEDVDSKEPLRIVDLAIKATEKDLSEKIGSHSIRKSYTEDMHTYSQGAVDRRTSIMNTINNLRNNIKNASSSLDEEQNKVLEEIKAIKSAAYSGTEEINVDSLKTPGFSKKYALIGFILGVILYAGIYSMLIIFKKNTLSASTVQSSTGVRMLGDIYMTDESSTLRKLLTSKRIMKWRYGTKLNKDNQIDAISSKINSICSHQDIKSPVFLLCGVDERFNSIIDLLKNKCKSEDKSEAVDCFNADEMDENKLNTFKNAIYVVSNKTRTDNLHNLVSLCSDYDVNAIGSIYLEAV